MTLLLPNLDDRRWEDLVEEGRALIPLYGPEWTDHNVHDPGIMLMELLAWVAEMDVYWLNRVSDAQRRKFLALAGIQLGAPRPAQTVLHVQLKDGAGPLLLPAATQFAAPTPGGPLIFSTLLAFTAVPGQVEVIQQMAGGRFADLTPAWQRGEPLPVWGQDPRPGAALYLGLSRPLPPETKCLLYFSLAGEKAQRDEFRRILDETTSQFQFCRPALDCEPTSEAAWPAPRVEAGNVLSAALAHHAVATTWEYLDLTGRWRPLMAHDRTRAFTLSGRVELQLPRRAQMGRAPLGEATTAHYYLRCRYLWGEYEAAPLLTAVALNGISARQAVAAGEASWAIKPGAVVPADALQVGEAPGLRWQLDQRGDIQTLARDPEAPSFLVLDYQPPGARPGKLVLETEFLGLGDGRPWQEFALARPQVTGNSLQLVVGAGNQWQTWEERPDFDSSRRRDAHFTLDPSRGTVRLGDGEQGRVAPSGALLLASYRNTRGEEGRLRAGAPLELLSSAHNRALIEKWPEAHNRLARVVSLGPAADGANAETVMAAAGRALRELNQPRRAVTAADHEQLALATPGVHLARAAAWPNLHPAFPCYQAPGVVTVIILPFLPPDKPEAGAALRQRVARYLARRRVIGSRIEVVGPTYRAIAIRARVRAGRGVDSVALRARLGARVDDFFHPLRGGPDGGGWPFGRDVYRSEVLQVLDETPGVEHVLALEILADGCDPQCANVCLGPLGLVAAGEHEIAIVAWSAAREEVGHEC